MVIILLIKVPDLIRFFLGSLYPQGIMDHHDDAGFHVPPTENPIKPQHCGFDQVGFDLLGPRHFETALQSLARIRVESPDPSQRTSHYTVILRQPLEFLPFSIKEFLHAGIPVMELIDVPLRLGFINKGLLLLRFGKSTVPLEDLGIDPPRQSGRGNTKADTEVHLFGQITVNAEQSGRLSVYVSPFIEDPDQPFITGQMSQNAELRLRIVGLDEYVTWGRHEEIPQATAHILHCRLSGVDAGST